MGLLIKSVASVYTSPLSPLSHFFIIKYVWVITTIDKALSKFKMMMLAGQWVERANP